MAGLAERELADSTLECNDYFPDISCCNCQERIVDLHKRFAELKRKLSEIENMLEYGWADPDGKLVDPGGRAPWIDYGRDGDFIVDVPEPSVRCK